MIKLKDILYESVFPRNPLSDAEVSPDISASALVQYMKDTYNMDFMRKEKGEYIFRRDDGRWFFYTIKDLRDLGAPLSLSSRYDRPNDKSYEKVFNKKRRKLSRK